MLTLNALSVDAQSYEKGGVQQCLLAQSLGHHERRHLEFICGLMQSLDAVNKQISSQRCCWGVDYLTIGGSNFSSTNVRLVLEHRQMRQTFMHRLW